MPVDDPQTHAGAQDHQAESGAGSLLNAARLGQGLTLEQVAEKLHLDESVIVGLETEAFDALGAPVFVRGHLKAYATLLGLSSDQILSLYHVPHEETKITPLLSAVHPAPAVSPLIWGCSVLAIIVMIALGMYIMDDDSEVAVANGESAAVAEMVAAESVVPVLSDSGRLAESGPSEPESVLPESVLIQPPVLTESAAELTGESGFSGDKVRQPDAEMRLSLNFSQDSWVEISDASDRLLFGLQRAGVRELRGEAPFSVLIGNARGVSLTVNGRDFDIPLKAIRGKVARFEITAEDLKQD